MPPSARLGCGVLLALSRLACADPIQLAARDIETVVITGTRAETRLEDMPLHTTVVTRDEIDQAPARDPDQLLRMVPGMNFTGVPAAFTDPTGQQTRMRGLGNAKVLVLLDGVPVLDPFYITTQWYKLPLSSIDHVEVLRGGNSSVWGNLAVAGVVNVISKRAEDSGGEFEASIGNYGTHRLSISKNWGVNEALSINLAADVFHTDGYQTTPAGDLWRFPQKRPVATTDRNLQLTAWFKPSTDLKGWLRAGYHVQDQDISYRYGANVQKSPDIAGGITKSLGGDASLTANAWAQFVNFEKFNGNSCYYQGGTSCLVSTGATLTPARVTGNVVQYYTQYGSQRYREQGGSLVFSRTLQGVWRSMQVGVDARRLSAQDTEAFYGTPANPAFSQGNLNSRTYGRGVQMFKGLFGQVRFAPFDALTITASARADSWRNGARQNTRSTATGLRSGGDLPETTKSALSPSVAARYDLTPQLALRGAAYKAFRAPGFNNLTRSFGSPNPTIANPFLEPEKLTGWELGADYREGSLSLQATWFLYNIRDMIATYRVTSAANAPAVVTTICGATLANCAGSANFYTNDQDGQSHGLEASANWEASSTLALDAAWTHTETYLTRHGSIVTDPVGVQLVALPKDVVSLAANWKLHERLRVHGELRYVGPMLLDTTSNAGAMRFGQGGSSVVNLSVNYAPDPRHEWFASIVNLFDREYSENAYLYNQPYNRTLSAPRSLNLGLRMRF